jgi:D-3-phosphoglycerate dehydrogenase
MAQYKAVVVSLGYETYQYERDILEPIDAEVIISPVDCSTEDEVIEVSKDADAIFVRETPITAKILESFERCKIVARYGVGLDNIDLETAKRLQIYVANVPEYGTEDVSDHAAALLLGCIRTLLVRDLKAEMYRTTGKTLGIIGYGKIARAFHRKWMGFLPDRVLVYDPFVDRRLIEKNGAEKMDLNTILTESDFISIHTPLIRLYFDPRAIDSGNPPLD